MAKKNDSATEQTVLENLSVPVDEAAFADPLAATADAPRGLRSDERLTMKERLAYGVGDIGGNLIFAPISAFILFYFTDTVGIGAAIAGTLLLFGRILDGTLDIVIGTLIDRTSTRWGKARPWILFSTPVLALSFVGLFNVPAGLDETGKAIYAFCFYFFCLAIGFTSSNLAYHTLLSVITTNSKMRVSLTVIRTFFAIATTMIVNIVTIPVLTSLGGGQQAWTTLTATYAIIAVATFLVLFFGTRERVRPALPAEQSVKLPLGKKLGILFRNPYFYLAFGFFLVMYALTGTGSVGVYFARDVLGDVNLYSLLSFASIIPLLIGLWFMPAIIARIGKRRAILIGCAISIVGIAITLIDPTNFTLVLAGSLVRGIGGVPAAAGLFALVADVVDYGEWKSGVRLDGMTFASATTGQNLGAGIGAGLVGWLLAAGGYDGQAASQPASAVTMEIFLMLWVPLIGTVLLGVIIYFLNIDKRLPEIQRELTERREKAAEAA
jgi:glycoside/pentoside/hexuronide:cation symporter, GPH family